MRLTMNRRPPLTFSFILSPLHTANAALTREQHLANDYLRTRDKASIREEGHAELTADHSPEKSRPAFYPCFLQTALPWVTGALLHAVRRISPQHSYQCDRGRASLSTDSNTLTRPR